MLIAINTGFGKQTSTKYINDLGLGAVLGPFYICTRMRARYAPVTAYDKLVKIPR